MKDDPEKHKVATPRREREFGRLRDSYRREILQLSMFTTIYRHLHERKHDRLAALNEAPAFFQTMLISLKTSIVLSAYALLVDQTKNAQTIDRFLLFISKNADLFTAEAFERRTGRSNPSRTLAIEDVRGDRRRINKLSSVQSLRILRNRVHAHFDPTYFTSRERLATDAPWTWMDLREMRETIVDVFNRYSRLFDGETFDFVPQNAFDVDLVLEALASPAKGAE